MLWFKAITAAGLASAGLPRVAAADDPRAEFLAIAERLEAGANPYVGTAELRRLEQVVRSDPAQPEQLIKAHMLLAFQYVRVGDLDRAQAAIDRAFSLADDLPGFPASRRPSMHRMRALVHLRRAEQANCVQRHNRDCCLLPLAGGGRHAVRAPAERARAEYLAYLGHRPDDLAARWLLNVSAMALGEHPDGVPPQWRIPPSAFASEHDIGRFVDIAPALGVDGFNLCGGVAVEDFDGDGQLDIVTSTFDPRGPLLMYRRTADGGFVDAGAAAGLSGQLGGLNLVAADYDDDGDMDLLVLRGAWLGRDGRIRNSLLRNDGRGRFDDVTAAAGLAEPAYPTQTAAWLDYDRDGDLDVYIGNESIDGAPPYPGQLFRNNGDGTFTDVARRAGVRNERMCKAVAAGDIDNDGDLDLYLSNIGPNRLYRNNGDGTFTDIAERVGVTEPRGRSFACWFFDYDNDGRLDLFVAAYDATMADVAADTLGKPHSATAPSLYRNLGDRFEDVSAAVGLDHAYLPMGANFGDADNDGWLDIYLATGDPDFRSLMPNVMLRGAGGKRFQDVSTSGGLGHLQKGHGVAFADFDGDGDQDIYHQLGGFYPGDKFSNALFANPGHGHHHIAVDLVGTRSNRRAVGARMMIHVRTPAGRRVIHTAVGCVSSFGGSPLRPHIGLGGGAVAIERIEVTWPLGGPPQVCHDVPIDGVVRIVEGQPGFERVVSRPLPFKVD